MKTLIIPDVHLKPHMFTRAAELMHEDPAIGRAVCLMDIPDDWRQEFNIDLYMQTFDAAIAFAGEYPDTLWCLGNHDFSYLHGLPESGFSTFVLRAVNEKLRELKNVLPSPEQMAVIHRIDNVLFLHGGLSDFFVRLYVPEDRRPEIDLVIESINALGAQALWHDDSPLWYRPQYYKGKLFRPDRFLQVVGHTPVERIRQDGSVISCDVFSTYRDGRPIGTQSFLLLDTLTWEWEERR